MGSATMIMHDIMKLRVDGTLRHSILPVRSLFGHTGPAVFMHEERSCRHVGRGTVLSRSIRPGFGRAGHTDSRLGYLEDDVASVVDDLHVDLDELTAQRGRWPLPQCTRATRVSAWNAPIVGERVKLVPSGGVKELAMPQTRPLDGVLAFLDRLPGSDTLIVECDDLRSWIGSGWLQ